MRKNTFQALLAAAVDVELSAEPAGLTEDGQSYWLARCQVPFELDASTGFCRVRAERAEGDDDTTEQPYVAGRIKGVASSTSQDWYGTEMSLAALEDMAGQFRAGVPYVPGHWECEWDDVMGQSVAAVVVKAEVERGAEGEPGFALVVESDLDCSEEHCQKLLKKLDAGHKVGQSIGGWFTEVRYLKNDDGEIDRIIIEKVRLDHLAVTRRPANPDCWIQGVEKMRSILADAVHRATPAAAAAAPSVPPSEPVATRSVDAAPAGAPEVPAVAAAAPLDIDREAGDDSPSAASAAEGTDAHRGAPSEAPAQNGPTTEDAMPTIEEIRALLTETVAPLALRIDALDAARAKPAEAPAAPATPAKSARELELEAQLAESRATMQRVMEQPLRRGITGEAMDALTGPFGRRALNSLCARAKAAGAPTAAEFFANEKRAERFTSDDDSTLAERAQHAESDLIAGLRAFEADGLLKPLSARTTQLWS